jgi:molybdenum cofactor synthesis domain-containing protein
VTPVIAHTSAALVIGNELLTGKVAEGNLVELARTLRALGVRLGRVVIIPDTLDAIADEVRLLSSAFDVVFTSGGIGPTHDDLTAEGVARAFEVPLRIDRTIEAMLSREHGGQLSDAHRRMALVPEGATLASTDEVAWPTVVMKNVWMLPGVPEIFRMKLSVVRAWIRGPVPFVSRAVFTQLDEAELKPLLDRVVEACPSVDVGSYPKLFDATYKTQVTFDAADRAAVDLAVERFVASLPTGEPQRIE